MSVLEKVKATIFGKSQRPSAETVAVLRRKCAELAQSQVELKAKVHSLELDHRRGLVDGGKVDTARSELRSTELAIDEVSSALALEEEAALLELKDAYAASIRTAEAAVQEADAARAKHQRDAERHIAEAALALVRSGMLGIVPNSLNLADTAANLRGAVSELTSGVAVELFKKQLSDARAAGEIINKAEPRLHAVRAKSPTDMFREQLAKLMPTVPQDLSTASFSEIRMRRGCPTPSCRSKRGRHVGTGSDNITLIECVTCGRHYREEKPTLNLPAAQKAAIDILGRRKRGEALPPGLASAAASVLDAGDRANISDADACIAFVQNVTKPPINKTIGAPPNLVEELR
ncbi:MAG TPA: hypothetical protein VEJ63_05895 [Planctomycetota bacterium]|nr:hypothetical protein [Planctomycetota bacterium]